MSANTEDMINQLQMQLAQPPQPSLFGIQAPQDPQGLQSLLQRLKAQQFQEQANRPTPGPYGFLHDAGLAGISGVGQQLGQSVGQAVAANQQPQQSQAPTPQQQMQQAVLSAQKTYQTLIANGVDENQARITASKQLVQAGVPGAADALAKAQGTSLENAVKGAEIAKNTGEAQNYVNSDARDKAKEARETAQNTWQTVQEDDNHIIQKNGLGEVKVQQKLPAAQQAAAAVSPDAMQAMLDSYHTTGTVPPGLARSPAMAGKFWDAEAQYQQQTGNTAAATQANKASLKANTDALAQTQKQLSATTSYFDTMDKNIDKARALANTIDFSDAGALNKAYAAWLKGTSDPTYAKYNLFFDAVTNEYAKIKSGSLGNAPVSDAARHEAANVLIPTLGKEGVNAVFDAIKDEGNNRLDSLKAQRDDLVGRISGKKTPTPPAATPNQNADNSGWQTLPNGVKVRLKPHQ